MSKQTQLESIKQSILDTMDCPLKDAAQNIVFGRGSHDATILFIGEAPGAKEDALGIPFVGAAGRELSKLLGSIGYSEDDMYIANILKYRPPKNRNPTLEEIKRHTPFLVQQIRVIQPKVIVTLGNFSTKFVLAGCNPSEMKNIEGISKLHGEPKKLNIEGSTYTVIPMYHPAAMLYNPRLRETLGLDFARMKNFLNSKD